MTADETVKVTIDIQTDGTHDTGLTIAEWNALTDVERSRIVQDLWEDHAGADNGGVHVETEGAEGV